MNAFTDAERQVLHVSANITVHDEPREIFFFREGTTVFWNVGKFHYLRYQPGKWLSINLKIGAGFWQNVKEEENKKSYKRLKRQKTGMWPGTNSKTV